ncbi:MAG: carboxypeptidase-like regulatory domain-containing protein [Prevotellaceae bacterium]|jgi:type 1 fimbria pilin|nr:carboxypeptidase-like regulatory domain-containing protein [Prevotellaceae bacterium]
MKSIVILAASVLLSVAAFANSNEANQKTVQLNGFVIDKENNEELVGAAIIVDGKKYYSDLDGNFSITNLKPGKCQIKVEFISYEPVVIEMDINKDETISVNLQQTSSSPIEENIQHASVAFIQK